MSPSGCSTQAILCGLPSLQPLASCSVSRSPSARSRSMCWRYADRCRTLARSELLELTRSKPTLAFADRFGEQAENLPHHGDTHERSVAAHVEGWRNLDHVPTDQIEPP